jgi:O-Antigen ligase
VTLQRNQLALGGALLALVTGTFIAARPSMALLVCGTILLIAVAAYGPQAVLILAIIAVPLLPSDAHLVSPSGPYPQQILVAVLILTVLAERRLWSENAWRLKLLRMPTRFFAVFLAIGLLSAVLSPLASQAFSGVVFYGVQLGGAGLAALILGRSDRADTYLQAISLAAICVALLAVFQYVNPGSAISHLLGPVFTSDEMSSGTIRALPLRVSGPMAHPVSLGAFSVITLPFALRAAVSTARRTASLGQGAVVMLLVAAVLSQTRMALLALPIVLLVWFLVSDRRRHLPRLGLVTVAVLLLTFGASFLTTQGSILASIVSYRGELSSSNVATQNVSGRTDIYETGKRAFEDRPLLGYGMRVPTENAQSPVFTRYGQPYAFESYFVVLALEVGLLGVLAFLGFFGSLGLAVRRHCPERADQATIFAAIAGGVVISFASNPFDVETTYFWLLLGIMLAVGLRPGGRSSAAAKP